jgi:hypothetical protein
MLLFPQKQLSKVSGFVMHPKVQMHYDISKIAMVSMSTIMAIIAMITIMVITE